MRGSRWKRLRYIAVDCVMQSILLAGSSSSAPSRLSRNHRYAGGREASEVGRHVSGARARSEGASSATSGTRVTASTMMGPRLRGRNTMSAPHAASMASPGPAVRTKRVGVSTALGATRLRRPNGSGIVQSPTRTLQPSARTDPVSAAASPKAIASR